MTYIESITLFLALGYSILQLYWSQQQWGAASALGLLLASLIMVNAWPLMLIAFACLLLLILLGQFKPEAFANQNNKPKAKQLRSYCQHLLTLSLLLCAGQYTINAIMLKAGITPWIARPDVVDAFLPIAGAIELKAIATLELWDQQHPAAAVMLAVVLITGVVCKRAFCGWACPLGLAGEYLYALRKRFIKSEYQPPAWIDWPLRMLKYLLLLGFIYIITSMSPATLPNYLNGHYHKIADIKMALFFITPGLITLICFGLILMLAAWRRQGFCRYLCPYGAVLGLLSFASPLKIRRDCHHCLIEAKDMKCDKCTRACPANIIVHTKTTVRSDECQACMRCIDACPKPQALSFSLKTGHRVSAKGLLMLMIVIMFALPLAAHLSGFWHSQTPTEIRQMLIHKLDRIGH